MLNAVWTSIQLQQEWALKINFSNKKSSTNVQEIEKKTKTCINGKNVKEKVSNYVYLWKTITIKSENLEIDTTGMGSLCEAKTHNDYKNTHLLTVGII